MHLRNIDLNLLTVFDAIMAEGNMTRAAATIGMTQPAISLAVSRLRGLVGDPLFERTGRGVKPTPRALAMAAPVRRALETIANAVEAGGEFDYKSADRTFKLVLSDYGEMLYLPPLMGWLGEHGASITIDTFPVTGLDVTRDLRFGTIDLLFWLEPIEDEEVCVHQLASEGQVCLVREDHPLADKQMTAEDYAALDHLAIRLPLGYNQSVVAQRIRARGLERRIALEVHSCHEMPPVIAATDLVCTLPTRMAEAMVRHYPLKIMAAPLPEMTLPVYMMWHRSMDRDPGHRWLRERLINIAGEDQLNTA